jgi:DNA-binding GntR family transcriptional regulator
VSSVSRTVLREQVKSILLHRIVSGELQPGERLVETRIAQELGTSQAPVREALEEVAARLAAEKLHGEVSALEAEVEAMRGAARRGDVQALSEHDIAFHRLIVEAADLDVLTQCWKLLGVDGRITLTLYHTYVEPEEAAELHAPILEAIRSGDGAAAGREARAHVEYFARLVGERGADA